MPVNYKFEYEASVLKLENNVREQANKEKPEELKGIVMCLLHYGKDAQILKEYEKLLLSSAPLESKQQQAILSLELVSRYQTLSAALQAEEIEVKSFMTCELNLSELLLRHELYLKQYQQYCMLQYTLRSKTTEQEISQQFHAFLEYLDVENGAFDLYLLDKLQWVMHVLAKLMLCVKVEGNQKNEQFILNLALQLMDRLYACLCELWNDVQYNTVKNRIQQCGTLKAAVGSVVVYMQNEYWKISADTAIQITIALKSPDSLSEKNGMKEITFAEHLEQKNEYGTHLSFTKKALFIQQRIDIFFECFRPEKNVQQVTQDSVTLVNQARSTSQWGQQSTQSEQAPTSVLPIQQIMLDYLPHNPIAGFKLRSERKMPEDLLEVQKQINKIVVDLRDILKELSHLKSSNVAAISVQESNLKSLETAVLNLNQSMKPMLEPMGYLQFLREGGSTLFNLAGYQVGLTKNLFSPVLKIGYALLKIHQNQIDGEFYEDMNLGFDGFKENEFFARIAFQWTSVAANLFSTHIKASSDNNAVSNLMLMLDDVKGHLDVCHAHNVPNTIMQPYFKHCANAYINLIFSSVFIDNFSNNFYKNIDLSLKEDPSLDGVQLQVKEVSTEFVNLINNKGFFENEIKVVQVLCSHIRTLELYDDCGVSFKKLFNEKYLKLQHLEIQKIQQTEKLAKKLEQKELKKPKKSDKNNRFSKQQLRLEAERKKKEVEEKKRLKIERQKQLRCEKHEKPINEKKQTLTKLESEHEILEKQLKETHKELEVNEKKSGEIRSELFKENLLAQLEEKAEDQMNGTKPKKQNKRVTQTLSGAKGGVFDVKEARDFLNRVWEEAKKDPNTVVRTPRT